MTDDTIPVFLYRFDYDDDVYYGTMRQVQAAHDITVLGVGFRPLYETIDGAMNGAEFDENVAATCTEYYYFENCKQ